MTELFEIHTFSQLLIPMIIWLGCLLSYCYKQYMSVVRWNTKQTGGGLLNPEHSVVQALLAKHPKPGIPSDSVLSSCEDLLYFEDSEITATHVQIVASRIQGGAGRGGCQSTHWREVLLQHHPSSSWLQPTAFQMFCCGRFFQSKSC